MEKQIVKITIKEVIYQYSSDINIPSDINANKIRIESRDDDTFFLIFILEREETDAEYKYRIDNEKLIQKLSQKFEIDLIRQRINSDPQYRSIIQQALNQTNETE
jgi:hypothetical protein